MYVSSSCMSRNAFVFLGRSIELLATSMHITSYSSLFNKALRPGKTKSGCLINVSSTHLISLYAEFSLIP